MTKTNAMRMLDRAKIDYTPIEYEVSDDLSATSIASKVGLCYDMVFKTLVAKGDKTGIICFCISADKEIDLKKAAKVSGNKKVEMIHVKDLLSLTGYIRGGCSPIGMKKPYPVYICESALTKDKITVSAGTRGIQLLISVNDLISYTKATPCDIVL